MSVNIEDLCRLRLITKTGLVGSEKAEILTGTDLFRGYITVTGLLKDLDIPEVPLPTPADPSDPESVAQAQAEYEAAVQARNTAIESRLINYVEQKKTWESQTADCDWLMMDPSSPAYIKNRTHYKFVDTPTKTTIVVGDKDCGITYDGLSDIVMLFYATGLQEEVTIWNDPENPIRVHVNGESLIPAEFHFNHDTGELETYQATPVSVFMSSVYLGEPTVEGFFGDGWAEGVVCLKTPGVSNEDEMVNYIAKELGYTDVKDWMDSWYGEIYNGGNEPDPAAVAAFDVRKIERFVEIQNQFLFPKLFGGNLAIFSAMEDYNELYVPAVENNDIPSQTQFLEGNYQMRVSLVNPSNTYINNFGLENLVATCDPGQNVYVTLDNQQLTGQDIIDNKIFPIIPLYPDDENYYDYDQQETIFPEDIDLEDVVYESTLEDFGETNLGTFESILDHSETKQLNMKFMPVGTASIVSQWKSFVQNSSSPGEPML